jgi:NAD(P)H-nitrite reductase large subunit
MILDQNDPPVPEEKDRTICYCHAVKLSELLGAIQRGARTVYEIQLETLASTGCGGCEPDILEILQNS